MKPHRKLTTRLLTFGVGIHLKSSRQVGAAAGDVALHLLAAALELSPGRPGTQEERLEKKCTEQNEIVSTLL